MTIFAACVVASEVASGLTRKTRTHIRARPTKGPLCTPEAQAIDILMSYTEANCEDCRAAYESLLRASDKDSAVKP